MGQARYTIILEFRGGTYVSQVEADDAVEAAQHWAERLRDRKPVGRSSAALAKAFLRDLDGMDPIPLDGLIAVWCFGASCGGSLALATMVRSD